MKTLGSWPSSQSETALIILAAGGASRMGKRKQLLEFEGNALLRRAARTALESGIGTVYAVLGAEAVQCEKVISDLEVRVLENRQWAEGMGTSILTGIRAVMENQASATSAILMLCDQPHLQPGSLRLLVKTHLELKCEIVASSYQNTFGAPALFASSLFQELLLLPPEMGAKQFIANYRHGFETVAVPDASLDVDTPEDYRKLVEQNG